MAIEGLESDAQALASGLYVIATPIGNLGDMTDRARKILKSVDHLLCEDTRVTGKLLSAYGIKANMAAYHDHNGDQMRPKIQHWLAEGRTVGLVSDAGTPLISDPGYKLVSDMSAAGYDIFAVPGASALTASLSIAGLPTDRVFFAGFPPQKSGARRGWFKEFETIHATLVFYESTHRLPESLMDAHAVYGDRPVAVCRELTKRFEEVVRGDLLPVAQKYAEGGAPKGECVVIIGPPTKTDGESGAGFDLEKLIATLLPHHGVKGTAQIVADVTGRARKPIYALAQSMKDQMS